MDRKTITALFHIFIIAPLFIYTGLFNETSEYASLFISLVMYTGLFAALYHGYKFLRANIMRENKLIYGFHTLLSTVFIYIAYEYFFYSEVSCSILGTISGFGIIALIIHSYTLLTQNYLSNIIKL